MTIFFVGALTNNFIANVEKSTGAMVYFI